MKKLISQFIEKLNKDGVFSEEQIKEFEEFGASIQKMIDSKVEEAKQVCTTEKDKEMEDELEAIDKSFSNILKKVDEVKEAELKLALCEYRKRLEVTTKESVIVGKLSKYLDEAVKDHLPEQLIVDYAKMERLENTMKTIRESLIITTDEVQAKVDSIVEDIQEQLDEKSNMLNEALERNIEYKATINRFEATDMLNEKLKDIPEFEANKLRRIFKESTAQEIEEQFDEQLQKIDQIELIDESQKQESASIVKEDVKTDDVAEDEITRYARLADRWIPKR